MGIRIHKMLGYGLNDLKIKTIKGYKTIVDDRINPKGYLLEDCEERDERWTLKGYYRWLAAQKKALKESGEEHFDVTMEMIAVKEDYKADFYSHIVHDSEYGMPKVVCICPIGHRDNWMQYDNTIDYYADHIRNKSKGSINHCDIIHGGIYPYQATMWDCRDGRRVRDGSYYLLRKSRDPTRLYEEEAQNLGFSSALECEQFLRPMVPPAIQLLCRYLEIFNDDVTLRSLQPMLYTYWS